MSSLQMTDSEAAAVQKTPNRVTLDSITAKVLGVEYHNPKESSHTTVAYVMMANGYMVMGTSTPADPANFNEELGKKFAYEDAIRKVWPLEGYLLCEKLAS